MSRYLTGLAAGVATGLSRLLPHRAALLIGRCLGTLGYYIVKDRRETALGNLDAAYGDNLSKNEKKRIARKSFENLGRNAMEFLQIPYLSVKDIENRVSIKGERNLEAALGKGRGAFILSAHLGNWELFAVALAAKGYPIAVITKISRSEAVNRMWMGYREDAGIRILKGRGLLRDTVKHLRAGGIVGFVLDQNTRRTEGVFVPFFGREACTLKSLAVLARRTGAPIVPAYTYRDGKIHHIVIEEPLCYEATDDLNEDIYIWTRGYTEWTERVIRLHPEQWTWLHDRWKTRPKKSSEFRVQSRD